jgi:Polysulphide reductase
MKKEEKDYLNGLFTGDFSIMFWFAIMVGMIIPIIVLIFPKGRKPKPMFVAGVMVVVGAWFKRYLIVTPTLLHPFLPKYDSPARFSHYFPSWEEWAITIGSMAGVLLIITFFVRVFPVISIYKTITDQKEITEHHETVEQYKSVPVS